jgi:hypothetical protein
MSHVLHLWRQPLPSTLTQAEALLRDLRQQLRLAPDPAAHELLAAIRTALPDTGDADAWWNEPPEPDPHAMVLSLSLRLEELTVVLPAIEQAARRLGWVVLDPQAGEARLPSGQVLSRTGQRQETLTEPTPALDLDGSPAARSDWLHRSLTPIFARRGWRATRGEFRFSKAMPFGRARVYSQTRRQTLDHGVWLSLNVPPHLQAALNSDGGPMLYLDLLALGRRRGLGLTAEPPPPLLKARLGDNTYALPFGSAEQAQRRHEELAALYDEVVLDWLDTLGSLQDLEHWANRVPDADCPFVGLRHRDDGHRLLNHHPDLLLAAAAQAPDAAQRARERILMYQADAFGRGLLPHLHALLDACGLKV